MKSLLVTVSLLGAGLFLTGCETTIVEHRPGYPGYHAVGYYERGPRYHDYHGAVIYRDDVHRTNVHHTNVYETNVRRTNVVRTNKTRVVKAAPRVDDRNDHRRSKKQDNRKHDDRDRDNNQ